MHKIEMLEMRLGGQTYGAIASKAGVSRQRVQQILSPPTAIRNLIVKQAKGKCQDCGIQVGRSGHVHHIGGGHENYNDIDNLQLLCPSCHRHAHPSIYLNTILEDFTPISQCVCRKCNYQWIPRTGRPTRCPQCQTVKWRKQEEM